MYCQGENKLLKSLFQKLIHYLKQHIPSRCSFKCMSPRKSVNIACFFNYFQKTQLLQLHWGMQQTTHQLKKAGMQHFGLLFPHCLLFSPCRKDIQGLGILCLDFLISAKFLPRSLWTSCFENTRRQRDVLRNRPGIKLPSKSFNLLLTS